jgi:HK97 gp10 family phage protein
VTVRVDASELYRLAVTLTAVGATVGPRAEVAVTRTTLAVEADAKLFVPVDTGNLRNSIGHDITATPVSVDAEVGPTADYGAYVELGTSRMAPHAYLGPAFDRHAGELVDALADAADPLAGPL